MAAAVFKIGHDYKCSIASVECEIVREVTLNVERPEVDGTTRGSANRVVKGGKKTLDAEIVMLHDPTNAGYVALREALLDGTSVTISVYDDASNDGPTGDWTILKMGRPEPMDGEVVVTFSAKPAGDITWTGGSGS